MLDWQSGYVRANRLRIHYYRTGGEKPAVVLAHGFSDDGLCWTPVAQALTTRYDVVMVDARGHGRSDAPACGYGPAEHSADLAGVIEGLGLRRPAILGHSMGAATALALAGSYPDLPGSILLEDPPAWWMPEYVTSRADDEWWAQRAAWLANVRSKTPEQLIAEQRAETPWWPEAELEPWASAKLRLSRNVLNRQANEPVDWPATLQRVTCPALLITGDPHRGAIVTEDAAARLREHVPQLRVEHVEGAGHSIRRDQRDRYMEVIRAFLHAVAPSLAR